MDERDLKPLRWTRSARKHKIGKAHALAALENAGSPTYVGATGEFDARLVWIGPDDRGLELEIVALDLEREWLVIHVMPREYGRNG